MLERCPLGGWMDGWWVAQWSTVRWRSDWALLDSFADTRTALHSRIDSPPIMSVPRSGSVPKRSGKKKQQAANEDSSSDRERFDRDEDWEMIAATAAAKANQPKQKQQYATGATIEEITTSDEEAEAAAASSKPIPVVRPSKKAAAGGVKLTPTQRKAMQKANKNPHTGKKKEDVVIESGDESGDGEDGDGLIDEEADGASGLSDDSDSDAEDGGGSDGEAEWERDDVPQVIARKKPGSAASSAPWTCSSILMWVAILLVVGGLIWIRLQDAGIWDGIDPDDIDLTSKPPTEQEDYYHILQVERKADLKQIKASYRKLVLKTYVNHHKSPRRENKQEAIEHLIRVMHCACVFLSCVVILIRIPAAPIASSSFNRFSAHMMVRRDRDSIDAGGWRWVRL